MSFDARFEPIQTPFVNVRKMCSAGTTGDGRYEIKTRNGKHYFAIVVDRRVRQAWTKTNHTLVRGKPAFDFVEKQLRERGHIN